MKIRDRFHFFRGFLETRSPAPTITELSTHVGSREVAWEALRFLGRATTYRHSIRLVIVDFAFGVIEDAFAGRERSYDEIMQPFIDSIVSRASSALFNQLKSLSSGVKFSE